MGIHAVWTIVSRRELKIQRPLKVFTYQVVGEDILDPMQAA